MPVELDPKYAEEVARFSEEEAEKPVESTTTADDESSDVLAKEYDPVSFLKEEIQQQEAIMAEAEKQSRRLEAHVMFGVTPKEYKADADRGKAEQKEIFDQALVRAGELNRMLLGVEDGDAQDIQGAQTYFSERIQGLEERFSSLEEEVKNVSGRLDEMRRAEMTEGIDYGVADYDRLVDKIAENVREVESIRGKSKPDSSDRFVITDLEIDIEGLKYSQRMKEYGKQAHELMSIYRRMEEVSSGKERLVKMRTNLTNKLSGQKRRVA